MKKLATFLCLAITISACETTAHQNAPAATAALLTETPEEFNQRMAWWKDATFGMFIHWGLYAVPAGTYNKKNIPGIGEWIMDRGEIPVTAIYGTKSLLGLSNSGNGEIEAFDTRMIRFLDALVGIFL